MLLISEKKIVTSFIHKIVINYVMRRPNCPGVKPQSADLEVIGLKRG